MAGSDEPNDSEDVRRAIQNAMSHRERGENPEAAGWYRRAAKLLLEDGVEDRALEYARLAADLEDDDSPAASGSSANNRDRGGEAKAASPVRGKTKAGPGGRPETGRHKAFGAVESRADTTGRNKAQPGSRTGATGKHKTAKEVFAAAPVVVAPKSAPPKPAPAAPIMAPSKPASPPTAPGAAARSVPPKEASAPIPPSFSIPLPRPSSVPAPKPSAQQPSAAGSALKLPLPAARSGPVSSSMSNVARPATSSEPRAEPARASASPPAASWSVPPPAGQIATIDYVRARLPSLPFFDELTTDQLREAARQIHVLECDDGELIFNHDAPTGPMFVVTSGNVHVETMGDSPFSVTVNEDSVLGVVSAMFRERRLARARARGPVEAFARAPSLARSLARESAVLRTFLGNMARARVAALLPHVSKALSRLGGDVCSRIIELAELVTLEDGATLQLEGVPARAMYTIGAGEAELFGEPTTARVVRTAGVGEVIGVESLRDESPPRTTVRAARTMLVARLSRAAYRKLDSEFPHALQPLRDATGEVGAGSGVAAVG